MMHRILRDEREIRGLYPEGSVLNYSLTRWEVDYSKVFRQRLYLYEVLQASLSFLTLLEC